MPVMDGIEATHEILDFEEDEEVPHIPIVALTANALKGDRERFLGEGMDEYITKPIETTELLYILNKFLSHKAVIKATTPVETPRTEEPKEMDDNVYEEAHVQLNDIIEPEMPSVEEETQTILIQEEPAVESVSSKPKIVLVGKKYLLEERILARVLGHLGYPYQITKINKIADEIASGDYDVLFTDQDVAQGEISNISKNIVIISTKKSKDEIKQIIDKSRG